MSVDLLSIIVNSQWKTQQVGYHFTVLEPIDPATGVGRIWEMKSNAAPYTGWPADVLHYDANYIYFYVTEDDNNLHDTPQPPNWNPKTGPWSNRFDPTCFKMQIGVPGKGMVVLPRFLAALPWMNYNRRLVPSSTPRRRAGEERRKMLQSPNADTAYAHVVKCAVQQTRNLNVEFDLFDGPFNISWGGDLGDCPTYVLTRVYNAGVSRERYYYAQRPDGTSYGWNGWDVAGLVSGIFQVSATSYRNTLVSAVPPIPANPCKF